MASIRLLPTVHLRHVTLWLMLMLLSPLLWAETTTPPDDSDTLSTLSSFVSLRSRLKEDIQALNRKIEKSHSESEIASLKRELEQLKMDLESSTRNFENIAAGVDMSVIRGEPREEFDLQEEVLALLKPAIEEMKETTSRVRQKSELKKRAAYYQERLPVIEAALSNVETLIANSEDKQVIDALKETRAQWGKQLAFMQSELQGVNLQLKKLSDAEVSLAEASQSYLKSFFQKRGLYLTIALAVVVGVILLSRLSIAALYRLIPAFRVKHRSFRVRLVELLHRIFTTLFAILGPMIVFYLVEDWVLFSLGILLLLGIGWTLRQTVPRYWSQIQLFLNIGSVREGERIALEGLPWRVEQINVYSTLVNPTADLSQRVPIDELVDLKSRPNRPDEPWFPCGRDDWVILSDGVRGKVIGISHELVQLVERGGSRVTYLMADFLARSPRNLATNFRIKERIGISYALQRESTRSIPEQLHDFLQQVLAQEGYTEVLLNLRVEFEQAGESSLDLVVIADFSGKISELYNRLRRTIQRGCVDACSEHGWEIPFPQLTLHGAVESGGRA